MDQILFTIPGLVWVYMTASEKRSGWKTVALIPFFSFVAFFVSQAYFNWSIENTPFFLEDTIYAKIFYFSKPYLLNLRSTVLEAAVWAEGIFKNMLPSNSFLKKPTEAGVGFFTFTVLLTGAVPFFAVLAYTAIFRVILPGFYEEIQRITSSGANLKSSFHYTVIEKINGEIVIVNEKINLSQLKDVTATLRYRLTGGRQGDGRIYIKLGPLTECSFFGSSVVSVKHFTINSLPRWNDGVIAKFSEEAANHIKRPIQKRVNPI